MGNRAESYRILEIDQMVEPFQDYTPESPESLQRSMQIEPVFERNYVVRSVPVTFQLLANLDPDTVLVPYDDPIGDACWVQGVNNAGEVVYREVPVEVGFKLGQGEDLDPEDYRPILGGYAVAFTIGSDRYIVPFADEDYYSFVRRKPNTICIFSQVNPEIRAITAEVIQLNEQIIEE